MIRECIKMALKQVAGNKKRTFLTALGICIGIASVIALITIVQGVTGEVMGEFNSLGSDTLTVSATGSVFKTGLKDSEVEQLREIDGVLGVSPSVSGSTNVVIDEEIYESAKISGKHADYFKYNTEAMVSGRVFTEADNNEHEYVCIINETLAEEAFPYSDPIGETILVGGIRFTVVGVSADDDSLMGAFMGSSDYEIWMPYKAAMKYLGTGYLTSMEVYMDGTRTSSEVTEDLEALLDELYDYKEDCYEVTSLDSLLETIESIESMLTIMLAGIASISLIVGGIGIMNMMLVSVSERTKEIGLRKALGAEPRHIQLQFVVESIILSLVGGVAGIIIGTGVSLAAGAALGITILPSVSAILLGVGFSALVGIGFGWGPSKKASALHPIDALRTD